MPYRRLPNTDSSRLKALYCARKKGQELPPFKLAFSQGTYRKVLALLPSYEHALSEFRGSYNNQLEKNKDYIKFQKKAKLYLSHFIQVVNLAIQRGDLPLSTLSYFGLPEEVKKNPSFNSDHEIIKWGKQIIEGEYQRKIEGKAFITNPTIALVKVHYDRFYEVYGYRSSLKNRALRAQSELKSIRKQADLLIQQIWNEVENTFQGLPDTLKREKSSEFGVIYVYRKNELNPALSVKHAQFESA